MKLTSEAMKALKEQIEVLFSDNACSELFHEGELSKEELKEICKILDYFSDIKWTLFQNNCVVTDNFFKRKLFYSDTDKKLYRTPV